MIIDEKEIHYRVQKILKENKIKGWKILFYDKRRTAGECYHHTKEIYFSRFIFKYLTKDEQNDIILHEVAHIIAGAEAGHSTVWQDVFKKMGGSGETFCNTPDEIMAPLRVVCSKGCVIEYRYRRSNMIWWACEKHQEPLKIEKNPKARL